MTLNIARRGWVKIHKVEMVVLFYPDISNFTFWNVKIFLIDFLDELGNFKKKNLLQNVKFYILKCQGRTTQPYFSKEFGKKIFLTFFN